MATLFTVESLGESRGRGVVASQAVPRGTVLCVLRPDMATLYTSFAHDTCARCFLPAHTAPQSREQLDTFVCPSCDVFVLCARCHTAVDAEEEANLETSTPAGSRPYASLKAVHRIACAWFNELPPAVRAPDQDTDYLRFCLHYGARRALGDESIRDRLMQLEGNASSQSDENLRFCDVFARDRIVATFASPPRAPGARPAAESHQPTPRYTVSWQELRDVLLRTRCNSLGFPFNADATTGWALETTVCMLNHNCDANVAIVMAEQDDDCVRWGSSQGGGAVEAEPTTADVCSTAARNRVAGMIGVKALRDLRAGEELCISYVDAEAFDDDVAARTRHLLEQYRFVCRCAKCTRQRAARKLGA